MLIDELASNIFTAADDVKAQIAFNPDTVYSYRLIGYENRMLDNKDFTGDTKDAGEMGLGTDIVALFEIKLIDEKTSADAQLFDVRIRYKDPGESVSKQVAFPVTLEKFTRLNTAGFNLVSLVALFGDYLRNKSDAGKDQLSTIRSLALLGLGADKEGYRADYVALLNTLKS